MNHDSLVKDAAARSGLPEATVERVLAALADVVERAKVHPLGLDYLKGEHLRSETVKSGRFPKKPTGF